MQLVADVDRIDLNLKRLAETSLPNVRAYSPPLIR